MPRGRTPFLSVEFDDPTDLNLFLSSGLVESDDDSDDTVSDIDGPGRTVDNLISRVGRKLDNLRDRTFPPSDRRIEQPARVLLPRPLENIDAFRSLMNRRSLETLSQSDGTASDLIGPGRTLGKAFAGVGGKVEEVLGHVGARLGSGPNAIMDRIVTLLDALQRGPSGSFDAPHRSSALFRAPRPPHVLVDGIVRRFARDPSVEYSEMLLASSNFNEQCERLA
ncbi:hypothetical protein JAAARDRAFT_672886 [Jaapia argillacea MUCL 33604]|uniref:Uncharacterized protein n=1 Tax=Jaapia argillacea MUCL 33604 TaxID=933084 RepID=A0A067PXH7_9AGAM|nr:hypothetical protein JAAARDRAFT_672886 [Jaapia argillacea MUCL 33604]